MQAHIFVTRLWWVKHHEWFPHERIINHAISHLQFRWRIIDSIRLWSQLLIEYTTRDKSDTLLILQKIKPIVVAHVRRILASTQNSTQMDRMYFCRWTHREVSFISRAVAKYNKFICCRYHYMNQIYSAFDIYLLGHYELCAKLEIVFWLLSIAWIKSISLPT